MYLFVPFLQINHKTSRHITISCSENPANMLKLHHQI